MSTPSTSSDAGNFKPVPGGYVYRPPNPWIFGGAEHYFVTDAQKREIVLQSAPPSPVALAAWIIFCLLLGLCMSLAIIWFLRSGFEGNPSIGDLFIFAVTTVGAVLAAIVGLARRQYRRVQPLIATLPKSDQKITRQELRQAVRTATSPRQLMAQAAVSVFIALGSLFQAYFAHGPRGSFVGSPAKLFFLGMAILLAAVAIFQIHTAYKKAQEK